MNEASLCRQLARRSLGGGGLEEGSLEEAEKAGLKDGSLNSTLATERDSERKLDPWKAAAPQTPNSLLSEREPPRKRAGAWARSNFGSSSIVRPALDPR